ncbi:type I methionyl aminopeptidase [Paenibacillus elgii]|uniref:Methionine aminopeptidase n=1 Tax=Paenibacillus elgii TaxID=189691 RepID=A0A161SCB0_9BACL|nr:type I methionyl aminopeptidase [Paenibacillus elgii]KZE77965.1 methionine aminopeptidase [Paenibacillus elgii]MCM3274236.1 type I methionyl aminopeptidase [Paenibacillus elgii]NEN84431.1 type I methionyl aminopeptidase [Paenibacillus elgii]PUA34573.1 type I methionyl aminopeptidase [Paenibacillus elgii]
MIHLKTPQEIALMAKAGAVLAKCHQEIAKMVRPGLTTLEINDFAERFINEHGAKQVTKGYKGYPFATCASVNDVIAHGFPNEEPLQEGDILKMDIVCSYDGWMADSCRTYAVGKISEEAERLVRVTKECLDLSIPKAIVGNRIGDVMHVVQQHAQQAGFSIVRDLVGHGIGREMHEEPSFAHVGKPGRGFLLEEGMVITIEPMINAGKHEMFIDFDGWTARTYDGSLSAQFEHTIAITRDGPLILTE